jgi:serine protease DegQ
VAVDGRPIGSTAVMLNTIAQLAPGVTASFRFVREGREIELPVTVGKRPRPPQRSE